MCNVFRAATHDTKAFRDITKKLYSPMSRDSITIGVRNYYMYFKIRRWEKNSPVWLTIWSNPEESEIWSAGRR